MTHALLEGLTNKTILTLPGLDGSGPAHWQSRWEHRLLNCERVQMGDWGYPLKDHWVDRLDHAVRSAPSPVVLAAHSLGCMAVAWWAKERWTSEIQDKLIGALLVAPPDLERLEAPERIKSFDPHPHASLPFASLLVASRNDRYAPFEFSRYLARAWGIALVDLGNAGHINAESGLGDWEDGMSLISWFTVRTSGRSDQAIAALARSAIRPGPALPDWCWAD